METKQRSLFQEGSLGETQTISDPSDFMEGTPIRKMFLFFFLQQVTVPLKFLHAKYKFMYYLSRLYHLEQIWQEGRKYKKEGIEKSFTWQPESEVNIL
jgi:hypothetical protein